MIQFILMFVFCCCNSLLAEEVVFTTITSDKVQIDMQEDTSMLIFSDNVNIESIDFNVKSEHVEVFFDCSLTKAKQQKSQIKKIIASKRARFVQKYRCGEADTIVIDVDKQQLSLIGNAKVKDNKGVLCGQCLTIDNNSRILHIGSPLEPVEPNKNNNLD